MRFQLLSHNPALARNTRAAGKFSALALGMALGFEGVIAGPLHAAPTVGGDDNGPQVRILQPNYQDVLKGKAGILIAVQSAKFNPDSVSILVDDRVVLPPTHLTEFPSAHFDWDTKIFADGQHKLTVLVTDTQGFRGWAEVIVYINNQKVVDSTPPSLSWLNIKPMQQISGTAQIQLQAVDNFGVKWIIVAVNPANTPNQKPPLRSWLISHPPYTINFDTTAVPDGKYSLSAKAWDAREQEGSAPTLGIGVANSSVNLTASSESIDIVTAKSPAIGTQAFTAPPKPAPGKYGHGAGSGWTNMNTGEVTEVVVPESSGDGGSNSPTATRNTSGAGTTATVPAGASNSVPAAAPTVGATASVVVPPAANVNVTVAAVPAFPEKPPVLAAPTASVHLNGSPSNSGVGRSVDLTTAIPFGAAHALAPSSPEASPRPLPAIARPVAPQAATLVAPKIAAAPNVAAVHADHPPSVARSVETPRMETPRVEMPRPVLTPANVHPVAPAGPAKVAVDQTHAADVVPGMRIAALPPVQVPLAPPTLSALPQVDFNGAPSPAAVDRPTLNGARVAARFNSPQGDPRENLAAENAALSAPNSGLDVGPAVQGDPVHVTADTRLAALMPAAPAAAERDVPNWDQAVLTGPAAAHTAIADGSRLAALPREMGPDFAAPDHLSSPDGEGRVYLGSPVLSSGSHEAGTRIAAPAAVTLQAGADFGANLAASAAETPSRPVPSLFARAQAIISSVGRPMLSALGRPASLVTSSNPLSTRLGSVAAPSRTAEPNAVIENQVEKPRFSRLPADAGRPAAPAYSGGITVSPLAVSSASSHPAFHLVERTTNLRAVAARYGLPVEVLAACNQWTPEMKLVAGMKVKLPQELQVAYKGEVVKGDVASLLVGTTSVTAFRFLWEKEGGTLDWDAANRRVVARNGAREVVLSVGSKRARVDNKDVMMDLAAFLMSGRTMVPVRLFEEGLHAHVEWEPETGRMYVAMAN